MAAHPRVNYALPYPNVQLVELAQAVGAPDILDIPFYVELHSRYAEYGVHPDHKPKRDFSLEPGPRTRRQKAWLRNRRRKG
jgi:hypothetical protein